MSPFQTFNFLLRLLIHSNVLIHNVKHDGWPLCMTCATQINLPCFAYKRNVTIFNTTSTFSKTQLKRKWNEQNWNVWQVESMKGKIIWQGCWEAPLKCSACILWLHTDNRCVFLNGKTAIAISSQLVTFPVQSPQPSGLALYLHFTLNSPFDDPFDKIVST